MKIIPWSAFVFLTLLAPTAFGPAAQAHSVVQSSEPADKGEQLAFFQTKNIFHDGLVGTRVVALTFDDGPGLNTARVLAALKRYNIKATFFIVGKMAKAHPQMLQNIADAGHLLGNHSATHPLLGQYYAEHPDLLLRQIRLTHELIAPLMKPTDTLFFRAPYGAWQASHAAVLNADPVLRNYVGPIYWDEGGDTHVDDRGYVLTSADWDCWHRGWSARICAKGYIREIERKNGGVVLMHCINSKAGELVDAVIPTLIRDGFTFARLDDVKGYERYKTPNSKGAPIALAMVKTAAP